MKDAIFNKLKETICSSYGLNSNIISLNSSPVYDLKIEEVKIEKLVKVTANKLGIDTTDNLKHARFYTIEDIVDYLEYKAFHKETILQKQINKLFDESIIGEKVLDFDAFVTLESSLPISIRKEISSGKRCVWTKKKHEQFESMVQITFKGKDDKCYNIYVGFLFSTICVLADLTEHHARVMRKYGKWHNGDLYLMTDASRSKVPIFTKIFGERSNLGKPYFMPYRYQVLIAQQISNDDIEGDKEFYNFVGGMLTICQSLVSEIEGANLDKYSFADDLKAALRMFLLLN